MGLQIIRNINVDFHDQQYIMVNAKQQDDLSRLIAVTCCEQGNIFELNASKHVAYVRLKKDDEHVVFDTCLIDEKGRVLVELTEQMLAVEGICYVDLLIVNKGKAVINIDTGEITTIDGSTVASTMAFCLYVYAAVVPKSIIESSNDFSGFYKIIEKAEADYTEVINMSKSYAVGDAGGVRENEDTDNAKYYYEESLKNKESAKDYADATYNTYRDANDRAKEAANSAIESSNSASAAANSASDANNSAKEATNRANYAFDSAVAAGNSAAEAANSANDASRYSESAAKSADSASSSGREAVNKAMEAAESAEAAQTSSNNALDYSNMSKSYAVGNAGGIRENEDFDNAKYYYELTKNITTGLDSCFIPMGTIYFGELVIVEKATGYVYNIKNDFITDDTFREGAGKPYTAGTNVYYTANGQWDCFGGTSSPSATVYEVKSYLGI